MQETLMQQGWELMIFGMGTVFVFLALLVLSTSIMSALVQRYLPEAAHVPTAATGRGKADTADKDEKLLAVISAAIHKYRSRK